MNLHLLAGALLLVLLFSLTPRLAGYGTYRPPVVRRSTWLRLLAVICLVVGFAILILAPLAAMAQTAVTTTPAPAEPIQLGPFVTVWAPFVNAIVQNLVGVVITMVLGVAAPFVPAFLRSFFEAKARTVLTSAAQTWAGNVLAKVEGDASRMSFNIGNATVREGVNWIVNVGAKDAVKKLKLTPDDVAQKIVGEIGKLQAIASGPATAVPAPGK